VPPLRERRGDLPLLIAHFLKRAATRPIGVTAGALAVLNQHPFPGNVRELEHAIRHAVALVGAGDQIEVNHLPEDIAGVWAGRAPATTMEGRSLSDAVKEFEREYIAASLRKHSGSKTRTAEALKISRKNLWEKLRRHGLVSAEAEEEISELHDLSKLAGGGSNESDC
jgi:DNA-binding NtrC family response regulator